MSREKLYTILVNSSDGYDDCWEPFFILFKRYWPSCNAKIFLNTERKNFSISGLEIIATRIQHEHDKKKTWSECLLEALEKIETPLVLYFQEDYFLHKSVDVRRIEECASLMINDNRIGLIQLTRHGSIGSSISHEFPGMREVAQRAKYRISTQASLWRVSTLKSYLDAEENGWMFEIYGTIRAWKQKELFLIAAPVKHGDQYPIEYLHTGIIKGKWLADVLNEFAENGIKVNHNKRGVYQKKSKILHKLELIKKLIQEPSKLLKNLF